MRDVRLHELQFLRVAGSMKYLFIQIMPSDDNQMLPTTKYFLFVMSARDHKMSCDCLGRPVISPTFVSFGLLDSPTTHQQGNSPLQSL